MRPKVVIFTLLIAFAIMGAVAFFKGMAPKSPESAGSGNPALNAQSGPNSAPGGTNQLGQPGTSVAPPTVSPELHAAILAKELEEISDLVAQADGTNNPVIITALVQKLGLPDAEVRNAALDGLKQLNDTNAIPEMQRAADAIADAREKVAILDAIDYLKLPNTIPPPTADSSSQTNSRQEAQAWREAHSKARQEAKQSAQQSPAAQSQ